MIRRKYAGLAFPEAKVEECKAMLASAKLLAASRGIPLGALVISAFEAFLASPEPVEPLGKVSRGPKFHMLLPREREGGWPFVLKRLKIHAIEHDVSLSDIFHHILCKLAAEAPAPEN